MDTTDPKIITKVPITTAIMPFDGAMVIANRWWTVIDNCILFYRGRSPQCNSEEAVSRCLTKKLYPGADCIFIPIVYVEHRCEL